MEVGTVYRTAKLVPWYHVTKPECQAVTLRLKEQCVNSASYVVTKGPAKGMSLCKTHADMEDADTGRPLPVKPLEAKTILVRPE